MTDMLNSNESGYALIDALVGIAVGGLIMMLVAGGLRQISAMDTRLFEDARMRRDMLGLLTTLRQWIEPGMAHPLSNQDQESALVRPVAGAITRGEWALGRLAIRPIHQNQHQLELKIEATGSPEEILPLLVAPRIRLDVTNANHPFLVSFLTLGVQPPDKKDMLEFRIARPRLARPLCQAQPFHRTCLP